MSMHSSAAEGKTMKRLTQITLMGVVVLAVASLAAAQGTYQVPSGTPQPSMRFGNFIEIGNDVLMHIIATNDFRYNTTTQWDFERNVRDRVASRNDQSTIEQSGESDLFWILTRFGVDFRYQKSTEVQIVMEQRTNLDGNTVDDRMNSTNPGGTDIFGRAASTENKGYRCVYCWLDYKFEGTPLRMRVGFDLWQLDQAGLIGDNDPRFALFGDFGNFAVTAAAVVQFESQRIGLTNDNDLIYYTFSAEYNLRPHRFQLDVTYARDRFNGADTQAGAVQNRGQKADTVLVSGSWSGRVGPVRALVQGNVMLGNAQGANATGIDRADLTGIRGPDRNYDVFAGGVVAYGEVDLGIVRPFVGFIWGTADGDPTDHKLHGFNPQPFNTTTQVTGTPYFAHLDTSNAFSARDYACPARFQGLGVTNVNVPATASATNPGAPGIPGRSGPLVPTNNPTQVIAGQQNPYATGIGVTQATPAGGFGECAHTVTNPYNDRLGNTSHLGIESALSNPGTMVIPVGIRVFPVKGYEINAWYLYKAMVNTALLEAAFAPELAIRGGGIRKHQYDEIGGSVLWTLNSNFDIRVAGNVTFAGGGSLDLAHLGNCNAGGGGAYGSSARCGGKSGALRGEVRFRARF
jgi:hypothetical protein